MSWRHFLETVGVRGPSTVYYAKILHLIEDYIILLHQAFTQTIICETGKEVICFEECFLRDIDSGS